MQNRANFCKNTIFFSIYVLIFLFMSSTSGLCNDLGSPYIQRILLDNYGPKNNNFSILQDKNEILYIANSNGILQYDGNYWNLIKFSGVPVMDFNDNGVLFAGGYNKFGYFKSEASNNQFISLLNDTNVLKRDIDIQFLFTKEKYVYFSSNKELFVYFDNAIHKVFSSESEIKLYKANNQILLFVQGDKLYRVAGKEILLLPNSSFFSDKTIIDILPFNEQFLIKTKNLGFYIFDNYTVTELKTDIDWYVERNKYKASVELPNGNYAVGTEMAGIVIIDKNGNFITSLSEACGLYSLCINDLFVDKSNNLWALHNQALSRIEINSPYRYYNKDHGLKGNVASVIRFNDVLYVATSLGLYYWEDKENSLTKDLSVGFTKTPNIRSNCFEFHVLQNRLFISASDGIYEVIGERAELFYNREADKITSVLHSKTSPNLIYIGQKNGISAIRYDHEILIIEKNIKGINREIISIAEDSDGTLWCADNQNSIYRIDPFEKFKSELAFKEFSGKNILPKNIQWVQLYSIHDDILFSTSRGIYRYDDENEKFYKDTLLGVDFSDDRIWVYPIVEDNAGNVWFNIIENKDNKNLTLHKYQENDSSKKLTPLALNRIKDLLITSIHPDTNGIIWFGGFEGLISYDLNRDNLQKNDIQIHFNKIILADDSLIYQLGIGKLIKHETKHVLTYNWNDILFQYASPEYVSESQMQFKYKLDGFDDEWSGWSNINFKEYTNLYEGKYTFRVKAKDIYNNISDEINYSFEIKPPFYRSYIAFLFYVVMLSLLFVLINKWREYLFAKEKFRLENIINERTEEVVIQKEKADNLLERVLPKNTAKELKSGRKAGPYHYNMVTVLFSDIQGFTKISEQMDSELLIDELDKFFLKFDTVVERYNIEKIKTIGDAYMCAGGIPNKNRTNPVEVVLAAIEMQMFMKDLKRTSDKSTKHIWDLRIGIDTGPVVAGVLGRSKISYDIWGGTVNTASRMEASGEPGKINITENTYMLIKDFFICQYRGKMPVKYKGDIDMYFVEGFKPHLSSDLKGQIPNDNFFTQLQLLRINDVEEFVLTKLEEGLPNNLYYHNIKHTIDVVTQVELIGRSEDVSDEDILILKTAALFHDMGHLVNYDTHEEEGVKIAKKVLPEYHYNTEQINAICDLISVTQMPPRPKNLLEEIMCDADLDYLGRTDFVPVSINLYKELHERNKIDSILEWNKMQLDFIKKHHYFTKTAQKLREVNKNKQLENIQEEIRKQMELNDE